jgi:cytochrome bd-type quinol oxidase subunit 2
LLRTLTSLAATRGGIETEVPVTHHTADRTETSDGRRARSAWIYVGTIAIGLSLFAVAIVVGNVAAGAPPEADENTWAHLFQLAMAAQLPLLLLFLVLVDWRQRQRVILFLAAQIAAAAAAIVALLWSGY